MVLSQEIGYGSGKGQVERLFRTMEEERGEARGGRQQAQFEGRRVMYMAGGSS